LEIGRNYITVTITSKDLEKEYEERPEMLKFSKEGQYSMREEENSV